MLPLCHIVGLVGARGADLAKLDGPRANGLRASLPCPVHCKVRLLGSMPAVSIKRLTGCKTAGYQSCRVPLLQHTIYSCMHKRARWIWTKLGAISADVPEQPEAEGPGPVRSTSLRPIPSPGRVCVGAQGWTALAPDLRPPRPPPHPDRPPVHELAPMLPTASFG